MAKKTRSVPWRKNNILPAGEYRSVALYRCRAASSRFFVAILWPRPCDLKERPMSFPLGKSRSPQGETEDVAMPEELFEETRFERLLSVGDALFLSANLFPKPLVDYFPDVMIKC
jgi:hypothetical protein